MMCPVENLELAAISSFSGSVMPKIIRKNKYEVSHWVDILLGQIFLYRVTMQMVTMAKANVESRYQVHKVGLKGSMMLVYILWVSKS